MRPAARTLLRQVRCSGSDQIEVPRTAGEVCLAGCAQFYVCCRSLSQDYVH